MAVNIEIRPNENTQVKFTIQQIAALKKLAFGAMDNNYCLEPGETGQYTVMYNPACIGRGFEVWHENENIIISIPLPNTENDIRLAYSLAQDICKAFGTDSFIVDDQIVPFIHMEQHIQSNIAASENAINGIGNQIKNGDRQAIILFGALNPITIGVTEVDEIGGTLEGFEKFLNRLQQMDVYYATPKYYKLADGRIFGLYFVGEQITSVVPENPSSPFANIENLKGYYVRVPDGNDVPYADFLANCVDMGRYDSNHLIVCLGEKNLNYLAENCCVYVDTDNRIKGRYWGRMVDNGRNHMRKVRSMQLATAEDAGLNHLAVFLRWAAEHDLLSKKLTEKIPDIKAIAANSIDLRRFIKINPEFDCELRGYHFNKLCQEFIRSFYVFGRSGYPACVDEYAEKVLGSEKYHCEEYKDEAYLFVPYNEEYYKGLSKYIDKAWKKFNR